MQLSYMVALVSQNIILQPPMGKPSADNYVVEPSQHPISELAKDVPHSSASSDSMLFLETSYRECIESHDECRQTPTALPKRVLDVSGPEYKLVEASPNARTFDKYATLSYCWGNKGEKIATSGMMPELKRGIQPEKLPIAFQQAAALSQRLEIRYLWIDTICIIQDDERDWEEQAAKMADIFQGASITIAAASASNPYEPFLTERDAAFRNVSITNRIATLSKPISFKVRRKIALGIHAKSHQSLHFDPLDGRAWALQELELSTRLARFTRGEIQWHCKKKRSCECRTALLPSHSIFSQNRDQSMDGWRDSLFYGWHQLVQDYSSRKLTYLKDKVPALAGLATKFGTMTQYTYIAGLWKENLLQDMAWQRSPSASLSTPIPVPLPSFSWMSIGEPSDYQPCRDSYPGIRKHTSEIVAIEIGTEENRSFSSASRCLLQLRGPTMTAQLRNPTSENVQDYRLSIGDSVFEPNTSRPGICEFSIDTLLVQLKGIKEDEVDAGYPTVQRAAEESNLGPVNGAIKLMSLFTISHETHFYESFLVLGSSSNRPGAYERVGVGTGKIYARDMAGGRIPENIKPFGWLAVASESERAIVDDVVLENIEID
jgi:hypothetical protein